MRNEVGLFPDLWEIPKKENLSQQNGFMDQLKKSCRMFCLTLVAFLSIMGSSYAQTADNDVASVQNNGDIGYKFREEKKEARREKRSVRATEGISYLTKDLFNEDFPNAKNISWSAPEGFDEADFTLNNSKMMAFFDFDNELIGTGKYVRYNNLPRSGKAEIARKYPGFTPEKVMYYDDNENNDTNLDLMGMPMDEDSYFALMRDGNKEIVLQITDDGTISYFCDFNKRNEW